jgi:hypothetical protein
METTAGARLAYKEGDGSYVPHKQGLKRIRRSCPLYALYGTRVLTLKRRADWKGAFITCVHKDSKYVLSMSCEISGSHGGEYGV